MRVTLLCALALLGIAPAFAEQPLLERPNACGPPDQGLPCQRDADCAQNAFATRCIVHDDGRRCEIPCEAGDGVDVQAVQRDCAIGETCVEGKARPNDKAFYCKPTAFRMDLNLLDQCIVHFLEGSQPVLLGDDCALEANLSKMLDQNGDNTFDILDLDLCVLSFLEQPTCDPRSGECAAPGLVPCRRNGDCGEGLYCDDATHSCRRDCGEIAPREEGLSSLDRECAVPLTVCNRRRGRCVPIDPTQSTCQIDADCVAGAYCFLGQCAPRCSRAVDCPDSDWLCASDNTCRAKPHPDANDGGGFDPKNYSIHFTRDRVQLSEIQNVERVGVAIMDIVTRRQVVDDPAVNFGYRLQVNYNLKQDTACLRTFVDCTDEAARDEDESEDACLARQDDCYIAPEEEWIRLASPFGTINAQTRDTIDLALEQDIVDRLSPGVYTATVDAVFDNGSTASVPVTLKKVSPSGEYAGSLTVYIGGVGNALNGTRPLQFGMRMRVEDETVRWNDLLRSQNLDVDEDLVDLTRGQLVHAQLHGDSAFGFARAGDRGDPSECLAEFEFDPPAGNQAVDVHLSGSFNGWPRRGRDLDDETRMNRQADGVFRTTLVLPPGDYQYRFILDGAVFVDEEAPNFDADDERYVLNHRCGGAASTDNEIDFVGLYSPDQQRLRLIGIIEIPADFCVGLQSDCDGRGQLEVKNPFKRTIRRQIEFIGPFVSATGRFNGFYREKISGLAADYDVTLEGGFIMDQVVVDTSPIHIREPLLVTVDDQVPRAINYPDNSDVLAEIEAAIDTWCTGEGGDAARAPFQSRGAFEDYIQQAQRAGIEANRTTIFPEHRQFNDAIEFALAALNGDRVERNHLNIYDFLGNQIRTCDPDDPAPPPVCLDEDAMRCGLALHQKAIIEGWINIDAVNSDGDLDLFCPDTIALDGCRGRGDEDPDLFALQEHNRFWADLGQILKFDADRARSDAFLTLFRNAVNPFNQGAAIAYKGQRLREAVRRYDQALDLVLSPAAGKVLFEWPARSFKQRGFDWLGIMHTLVSDQMDALTDLVDLERRVFINTDRADYAFAQHLMQHTYLTQVFLMVLQADWQGDSFSYLGQAGPIFEQGQNILNRLNPARNDIGISPNRVFFENTNPQRTNWHNYMDQLVGEDGDGGILGDARGSVDDAVLELQAALADVDTLEEKLLEARFELVDQLDDICGDPNVDYDSYCTDSLNGFADEDRVDALRDCINQGGGSGCPEELSFACSGDDCADVEDIFVDSTDPALREDDDSIYGRFCVLPDDKEAQYVLVGGEPRACIGGQMGTALQEQAAIDLQRRVVLMKVKRLLQGIQRELTLSEALTGIEEERAEEAFLYRTIALAIEQVSALLDIPFDIADKFAEGVDCLVIAGLAVGTDCPQGVASKVLLVVVIILRKAVEVVSASVAGALDIANEQTGLALDREAADLESINAIQQMVLEVGDLTDEYQTLTMESFNIYLGIGDLRYYAQQAVDRFEQRVGFFAEHLIGRETGNILRGDQLVAEASADFHAALEVAYKMTVAFIHHYNVHPGEAKNLTNQILAAVTLDDIGDFAADLQQRHERYCARESIDCDASTNVEVLRYSIRDQLFPHLRPIVDARTGRVISAGEQFHNIITQPPYVRRRARGPFIADQIEIVLNLPLLLQEQGANGPEWLINPLACNHLMDSRDPSDPGIDRDGNGNGGFGGGTIAVNFKLGNLGEDDERLDPASVLRYEVRRGAVDYLRSCQLEPVQDEIGRLPQAEYPIRRQVIGYSPDSVEGQRDAPPSFITRSPPFNACLNHPEVAGDLDGAGCWRFFARDRSLSALDWMLVLPLRIGEGATENAWILGEGLADDERPLIEDIVVYFRHRTRPVSEF